MKKVKKIWNENKVLLVLAIILLLCAVIVTVVSITYFYGTSDNVYGNRLDIVKEVPLSSKLLEDVEKELEGNEVVKSVNVNQKGKIVYISIVFNDATDMDIAKKTALSVVELFNEDELNVYDLEFTINSSSTNDFTGYTLMGARNKNGSGSIVWNNYNLKLEEESAE